MSSMESMKDLLTQSAVSSSSADKKKLEDASTSVISVLGNLLGVIAIPDADGGKVMENGTNVTNNDVNGTKELSLMERKMVTLLSTHTRTLSLCLSLTHSLTLISFPV